MTTRSYWSQTIYAAPQSLEELRWITHQTIITIHEDYAHWELKSNQRPTEYDNLSWSVDGDCLSISGELNESFIIDIISGTAVSQSTGIEYGIFVMRGDETTSLVE